MLFSQGCLYRGKCWNQVNFLWFSKKPQHLNRATRFRVICFWFLKYTFKRMTSQWDLSTFIAFQSENKIFWSTYAKITLNVRTLLVPLSDASPSIFAAVTSARHRLARLQCSFGRNVTGYWTRQLTRSKPLFWQMNTKFPWKEQIYGISLVIGRRFFTCKSWKNLFPLKFVKAVVRTDFEHFKINTQRLSLENILLSMIRYTNLISRT